MFFADLFWFAGELGESNERRREGREAKGFRSLVTNFSMNRRYQSVPCDVNKSGSFCLLSQDIWCVVI